MDQVRFYLVNSNDLLHADATHASSLALSLSSLLLQLPSYLKVAGFKIRFLEILTFTFAEIFCK